MIYGEHIRWFIPACAGNTHQPHINYMENSVHPRVCGEHDSSSQEKCPLFGSSPRVRGTLDGVFSLAIAGRFIPACAGNTALVPTTSASMPVHPRVCGEHKMRDSERSQLDGSSPRVRGTQYHHATSASEDRFIPACAGNTFVVAFKAALIPVHPRVCGEHILYDIESLKEGGSSPRVRGTRFRNFFVYCKKRFIPACAGNTI